uniref:BHLH domain-containing protein n=1 Tax=Scophthalmus maximus TaxID=52904 RepID=A0A8D3CK70_SCOMX
MKLFQDFEDAKAQRKSLKPQVERRRRERMNRSLESLKTLLLQRQVQMTWLWRVEKSEILEHTVLFLQNTAKGDMTGAGGGGGGQKHSFQDGFSSCLERAAHFLGPQWKDLFLGASLDASARLARQSLHVRPHLVCAPTSSVASCDQTRAESRRSPTTPQQPRKVASRASKQSPSQSLPLSQALWRPWP